MNQLVLLTIFLIFSYLIGALPFGLWIALWLKGIDIRTVGSGNIGATNVSRICGPVVGWTVFGLDLLKGLIPPFVGQYMLHFDSRWIVLGALLAIIGHNFSIFLGFKGGKGISTSGGALLGVAPLVGLSVCIVFALFTLASSIISVGSLACAITLPFIMFWLYPHDPYRLAFGIAAALMAIYKHRKNIERLLQGKEPKIHLFKSKTQKNESATAPVPEVTTDRQSPAQSAPPSPEKDISTDASH